MKSISTEIPKWLLVSLLILLGLACVYGLWQVAAHTSWGESDFYKYWSASYLFSTGQNPYDPALMRTVQQTQIPSRPDAVIMAWNPPTLLLFLLPLAWFSYTTAKAIWLIVNVTILFVMSALLIRLYLPKDDKKAVLFFLLFAFAFPPVLIGIAMGQVTFLVPLGILACMALMKKGHWFWAGAVLILTTIKPHIVVLPFIYLLIHMAKQRQYKGWLGLVLAGAVCAAILFAFRPLLISDMLGLMKIAPVHWATPTIGGLLSFLQVSETVRYMIVLLLPLPFLLAKYEAAIPMELAVALLTLITVPTTFFGWSFDQTILLIPIAQVFNWLGRSKYKVANAAIAAVIVIALGVNYFQLAININDVFFLWVPIFWWLLFGLSWVFFSKSTGLNARTEAISRANL
jgi:hypothetical protein